LSFALPGDYNGFACLNTSSLRALAIEELGTALHDGDTPLLPADPSAGFSPISLASGIPIETLSALISHCGAIHVGIPGVTERGPRWLIAMEGPIDGYANAALESLTTGPMADELLIESFDLGAQGTIVALSMGRRGKGFALAVQPGLVLITSDIPAARDCLRGLAAEAAGTPDPESLGARVQRHQLTTPRPEPLSVIVNPRSMLALAYYEEYRARIINEPAAFDQLFEFGAMRVATLAWNDQGLRLDLALDPQTEVLKHLQPAPEGLQLPRLAGDEYLVISAALREPGPAVAAYLTQLAPLLRLAGQDDLDEAQAGLERASGLRLEGILDHTNEIALVIPLGDQRFDPFGIIIATFKDLDQLGALVAKTLGFAASQDFAVVQENVDGTQLMSPGRPPYLAMRGDKLATGRDPARIHQVMLAAETVPDSPALPSLADNAIAVIHGNIGAFIAEAVGIDQMPALIATTALHRSDAGLRLNSTLTPRALVQLFAATLPSIRGELAGEQRTALRRAARHQLRQVGATVIEHRNNTGTWPATLQALVDAGELRADQLRCPLTKQPYTYLLPKGDDAGRMILYATPFEDIPDEHLYVTRNGTLASVDPATFQAALNQAQQAEAEPGAADF
nr:hypothetical protein [Planctomycetota bacterium]